MPLWTMPAVVSALVGHLAAFLDRRTRERFWSVFFGVLLCREKRRTASAWFRAAGVGTVLDGARKLCPAIVSHQIDLKFECTGLICEHFGKAVFRFG
jgi:hypothetical protein